MWFRISGCSLLTLSENHQSVCDRGLRFEENSNLFHIASRRYFDNWSVPIDTTYYSHECWNPYVSIEILLTCMTFNSTLKKILCTAETSFLRSVTKVRHAKRLFGDQSGLKDHVWILIGCWMEAACKAEELFGWTHSFYTIYNNLYT